MKVPTASNAHEQQPYLNQVVLNIRRDGTVVLNKVPLTGAQLKDKLSKLAELYPDQAVIVRGDEQLPYKDMIAVLDICRAANIWNLIFATSIPQQKPS